MGKSKGDHGVVVVTLTQSQPFSIKGGIGLSPEIIGENGVFGAF